MQWQAPDYTEVLEQRLREARLDLLEDPRLARGLTAGPRSLEPGLIARVVRDKLAAAAAYGYEGIESSLRLDAMAALTGAGVPLDSARQKLDEAARLLSPPAPPALAVLPPSRLSPTALAGAIFAACALAALVLYAILNIHPLLLVCLVALGGIPALMVRNWALVQHAGQRNHLLDEYPSQVCRHYTQSLRERVAAYEAKVNEAEIPAGQHAHAI